MKIRVLCLCAAANMVAPTAHAQDAAAVQTAIKRLDAAKAQMKTCGWTVPLAEAALAAERGWAVAMLEGAGLTPDPAGQPVTGNCQGPEDKAALALAEELRFTWLARTVMYAQMNQQPGWSQDLFTLYGGGPAASDLLKQQEPAVLQKIGTPAATQLYDAITRESQYEAALVCPQRGSTAKGGGRACPPVPGVTPAQSKLALRRAELIEGYAKSVAALPPPLAPELAVAAAPAVPATVKYRAIGIMEYMNNTMQLKFSTPTATLPCNAAYATVELPEGTGEFVKQTVEPRLAGSASGGSTVTGHVWGTAFIVDTVSGSSPAAENVRQNIGGGGNGGIPMVKCY